MRCTSTDAFTMDQGPGHHTARDVLNTCLSFMLASIPRHSLGHLPLTADCSSIHGPVRVDVWQCGRCSAMGGPSRLGRKPPAVAQLASTSEPSVLDDDQANILLWAH